MARTSNIDLYAVLDISLLKLVWEGISSSRFFLQPLRKVNLSRKFLFCSPLLAGNRRTVCSPEQVLARISTQENYEYEWRVSEYWINPNNVTSKWRKDTGFWLIPEIYVILIRSWFPRNYKLLCNFCFFLDSTVT